jgi:hypothetical protein
MQFLRHPVIPRLCSRILEFTCGTSVTYVNINYVNETKNVERVRWIKLHYD